MKAKLDSNCVNKYIDLHARLNIPYKITISNYTTRIVSNAYDIHFIKNEQTNQTFAAAAKVKKDCLLKSVPVLQKDKLKYFSHRFSDGNFYADTIYNFDLKSAYATILFNDGYITEDAFKYVCNLPKLKRLAALGMLASKKNTYEISASGEVLSELKFVSPTSPYFFYCVQRMNEITKEVADILGNGFLFSWVDGIYFTDSERSVKEDAKIILEEYFLKNKLKVTFEVLEQFEIIDKNRYYKTKYRKEGEYKTINIPKDDTMLIQKITSYLLHK